MVRTSVQRHLHTIDATEQTLGRIASRAVTILRGKHRPTFAPNIDGGDLVRITNVRAMRFTGRKLDQAFAYRYSGYPGGLRATSLRTRWARDPRRVLARAVYGMLPSNRLRARMMARLSVTL